MGLIAQARELAKKKIAMVDAVLSEKMEVPRLPSPKEVDVAFRRHAKSLTGEIDKMDKQLLQLTFAVDSFCVAALVICKSSPVVTGLMLTPVLISGYGLVKRNKRISRVLGLERK